MLLWCVVVPAYCKFWVSFGLNRNLLSTNAHTYAHIWTQRSHVYIGNRLFPNKTNINPTPNSTHTHTISLLWGIATTWIVDKTHSSILYCFCIKQNHASFSSLCHIIITSHHIQLLKNPFYSELKPFQSTVWIQKAHAENSMSTLSWKKKVKRRSYRKSNNIKTNGTIGYVNIG